MISFRCDRPNLQNIHNRAVADLEKCVVPSPNGTDMLIEGAMFIGCWLESTGTISAEILSRFFPEAAVSTFLQFAAFCREDGLIPYKITDAGAGFRQVQMVTPLARSVWKCYKYTGDKDFLSRMYSAIAANDAWLARHRDTRGTGCVEAFCTFDTGHDASPRFWHIPDSCYCGDPARFDPDIPALPFLAPDLTANVYCQRIYLAKMARELGGDGDIWEQKAEETLSALMANCYDREDGFFYDLDNLGRFVKIQGDNLIRVLACEVGDDKFFAEKLEKYLLNTRKFFTRYPITTIALDDPRFSHDFKHNSWAGQVSFLTQIRLPEAFDLHGRHVELTWIIHPILTALSRFDKFSGSVSGWLGESGYSENYSPTMLCVLDYIERICGIYPGTDGKLWFTALLPKGMDYGEALATETAYSRDIDGVVFEIKNSEAGSVIRKNGKIHAEVPYGVRLVTDMSGEVLEIIGIVDREVKGALQINGNSYGFAVSGNEVVKFNGKRFDTVKNPGVVHLSY